MTRLILALLVIGMSLACGDSGEYLGEPGGFSPAPGAGSDAGGAPPQDSAFVLSAPAASQNYVFVANTTRGTLAKMRVVAGTVRISTIPVGAAPTTLAAAPDSDTVVVFNDGTSTITIVDGELETSVAVDVVPGATRMSVSPDAAFAVAWYRPGDVAFEAGGVLSEVSVVDVARATSVRLSTGVGVQQVQFSDDGQRVAIVTSEGISVADLMSLDTDTFAAPQPYATGDVLPLDALESLAISPDVAFAAAVVRGVNGLQLLDLDASTVASVPLPAAPSSVVIVGVRALAPLVDGTVAIVTLTDREPSVTSVVLPSEVTNSVVSPNADLWLGFNTADDDGVLTVLDLETSAVTQVDLRKGVRAIIFAPDGADALVLHTKAAGTPVAGAPEAEIIAQSYAFSLLDLRAQTAKLVLTQSQATEVTFTSQSAFVLTPDAGALVSIDRVTLRADEYTFEREPEHIGVVPGAGEVFVSQNHPLGRIAFVDIASGEVREITGYELNGLIE